MNANVANFCTNVAKSFHRNSPEILSALGIVGVGSTAYLTAKASFTAARMIDAEEAVSGTAGDRKERLKERTKLVWKLYIPPAISAGITAGCIFNANNVSGKRIAAAASAYSFTEKAFSDYKEKVVEQIGKNKEQKIRDELVQEKVQQNPPKNVIVLGSGHVLCCELYTGRYFKSDMETLKKAENTINHKINHELYVRLDDFYDLLGLEPTSISNDLGWDSDKLLELQFTPVFSEDGEPCLAFEYSYLKSL
jgi:hypothetical protein